MWTGTHLLQGGIGDTPVQNSLAGLGVLHRREHLQITAASRDALPAARLPTCPSIRLPRCAATFRTGSGSGKQHFAAMALSHVV